MHLHRSFAHGAAIKLATSGLGIFAVAFCPSSLDAEFHHRTAMRRITASVDKQMRNSKSPTETMRALSQPVEVISRAF